MQNMQVILYPKQIHIATNASISIRLTYKKIAITTNHQLEKYQNRQFYPLKNSVALINDQVKFKISKQFELHNTKIVIIVIGTKGRQVSCLGDICLDLAAIKQKKGKDFDLCKAKIEKCKDPKAIMLFDIRFIEKPVDLNELKRNKKQKIPELGILKTDHYYKEELYISRRQKTDKPTAYQISRKNYKNNQILRNNQKIISHQKRYSKDSAKQKTYSKDSAKQNTNNGSYKKRFLYEFQRNDNKSQKSSSSKSIRHNNYLSVYQKDKSPSPRIKTPEPITLQTLKSRQTHNRIKSKVQPLNLSQFDMKKVNFEDSNQMIDLDTFRANAASNSRGGNESEKTKRQNKQLSESNVSQGSLSSIKNEKESKYKLITDKLELIESKIRKRSKSKQQSQDKPNQLNINNAHHKISKSQIDQIDSYSIVNEYHVSRTLTVVSNPYNSGKDGEKQQKVNYSKHYLSPMSPTQSTCPQNEQAPSPIQVIQTPTVNKSSLDQIKMSQFTINSKKSQISEEQAQKSHQMSASQCPNPNPSPSPVNPKSFNQINLNQSGENQTHNHSNQTVPGYPGTRIRKDSKSPQSNGKRQISPSSLSFQRRESELKLQKKSSLGQNYLQIQVKMLQLEIQDKNMKLQKLQKKLSKKQEESISLSRELEQSLKKITSLSSQVIQLKTINLDLQRRVSDEEQFENKLKERQRQLAMKEQQINKLRHQIQSSPVSNPLNSTVHKQECKQCMIVKGQFQKELSLKLQQLSNLQQQVNVKNQLASDLQSQLETYQQQVSALRQRLNQTQHIRLKYEQLLNNTQSHLTTITNLQQKINTLEAQKISPNNSSVSQSMADSKSSKTSIQNQLAQQQVLKQTIQKQTLLQQSLKSLESRNKSLAEQLQNLQKQKQSLILQNTEQNQQISNINKLQQQYSQLNTQLKQNQYKLKSLEQQKDTLSEQILKKQKAIQKLSSVNESLQNQLYQINNQQPKHQQISDQTEQLIIKNAQNEQVINQMKQKLTNKQKQVKILKNLLNERQKQSTKNNYQNNQNSQNNQNNQKQPQNHKQQQMRRQLPDQSRIPSRNDQLKSSQNQQTSRSDEMSKIKVTEQGKQNFYEQYLNEKAKCVNLQAQLRYAQNEIRNHKMRIELLVQEKNAIQKQLQKAAFITNNDRIKETSKAKGDQKFPVETLSPKQTIKPTTSNAPQPTKQSSSESIKLQNKQAIEQIQYLQSQVRQLHYLLDQAIQKGTRHQDSQKPYQNLYQIKQNNINSDKYLILVRKLQAYQMELSQKKNTMAQIINAIWRGGNAQLIDQIDKIMTLQ